MTEPNGVWTYRGADMDELLPKIRQDLGPDAVVLERRETLTGGLGGFFQRREIELDARPAAPAGRLDVRDDAPAGPGTPAAGPAPASYGPDAHRATHGGFELGAPAAQPVPEHQPEPEAEAEPETPAAAEPGFAEQLTRLTQHPAPPPAHRPHVDPAVSAVPGAAERVDPADGELARLLRGLVLPAKEPRMAAEPEPAAEPEADHAALVPAPAVEVELPAAPEAAGLTRRGLSTRFARDVVEETVARVGPFAAEGGELEPYLRSALAARIPIATPKIHGAGGVVGFVGPGGSGKTRCVARLATAYATRSPVPVTVVALRPKDGGAELTELLRPAGVAVHAEHDAGRAAERAAELRAHTLVVLDTPAVSPRADAELRTLAAELRALGADELHLTVSATMGAASARELVAGAEVLGVHAITLTHLDETDQLGTGVELAAESGLPLSYVSRGTGVEHGLRPASAEDLARALLA
jgi:flagellar biosynthesis GTPase FlhF